MTVSRICIYQFCCNFFTKILLTYIIVIITKNEVGTFTTNLQSFYNTIYIENKQTKGERVVYVHCEVKGGKEEEEGGEGEV